MEEDPQGNATQQTQPLLTRYKFKTEEVSFAEQSHVVVGQPVGQNRHFFQRRKRSGNEKGQRSGPDGLVPWIAKPKEGGQCGLGASL